MKSFSYTVTNKDRALRRGIVIGACALVFGLTFALYWPTRTYAFLNYDDNDYVYATPEVTNGLSWASVKWSFGDTATKTSNWHPLTFLSLMTDVTCFGVDSGAMHLHNAALHACNSAGVFLLLWFLLQGLFAGAAGTAGTAGEAGDCGGDAAATTGIPGRFGSPGSGPLLFAAAFGALFWSLHPLRVESVAWVAQRKDVLSLFWLLLGALAFLRKTPEREWLEVAVLGGYAFAFMGKPTAVIFPALLILMEYALKRRVRWSDMTGYFLFALIFAVVTICAQKAVISKDLSLLTKVMNAVASVGDYLWNTVYPVGLAVFYPYERPISSIRMIRGVLMLLGVAHLLWTPLLALLRRHPPVGGQNAQRSTLNGQRSSLEGDELIRGLLLGFGWFSASLLPVIGLVHVGIASHADRYTYLSGIGLSIALAVVLARFWGAAKRPVRMGLLGAGLGVLAVLGILSSRQVRHWRDSEALFRHAIAVTHENHIGHCNLAAALFEQKRYEEAFVHCRLLAAQGYQEIAIPRLEIMLAKLKGMESFTNRLSLAEFTIEDQGDPLAAQKYHALGLIANDRDLHSAAESFARKSLELAPGDGYVLELLGSVLYKQRRYDEALEAMKEARKLLPKRKPIARALRVISQKAKDPDGKQGKRKKHEK
jgi:tetratricopeptide (TPR) repeat protein